MACAGRVRRMRDDSARAAGRVPRPRTHNAGVSMSGEFADYAAREYWDEFDAVICMLDEIEQADNDAETA